MERIFDGFAPAPQGTKSQYGDFLEYTDYSFGGGAVRVGPSTYVVEASYGVDFLTGTFMVVARNRAGHFEALWDIKRLAERHYAQRDEIGRWMYLVRRAYYSGPLAVGKILPVFPAANGHARFLVEAYQGADGGTLLAQLSIWEWDGTEAKPLLAEAYQYLAGDSHAVRFDGRTIRVSTKEELKVLSSCGACPEPRGAWTVLITPGGVRNLGHRLSQPELGWADELISRVNEGKDATDLASVEALTALKGGIREVEAEFQGDQVQPTDEAKFSPGMLDHCQVLRRGQRGEFVVQTDEARLTFRYTLRNGHPWFTSVEVKSPSEVK